MRIARGSFRRSEAPWFDREPRCKFRVPSKRDAVRVALFMRSALPSKIAGAATLVQSAPATSGRARGEDETMIRKTKDPDKLFKGRHFEREIIVLCVRWHLRYKL